MRIRLPGKSRFVPVLRLCPACLYARSKIDLPRPQFDVTQLITQLQPARIFSQYQYNYGFIFLLIKMRNGKTIVLLCIQQK